jgi:hypothetical protein
MIWILHGIFVMVYVGIWGWSYQKSLEAVHTFTKKQVHNMYSILHSLGCVGLVSIFMGWWTDFLAIWMVMIWSQSYYLFDMLNYKVGSIYIVHHLASVVFLMFLTMFEGDMHNPDAWASIWGLYWAEVSNWPMYYVYHQEHSMFKPGYNKAMWVRLEQVAYLGIRNLCGVWYLWVDPVQDYRLWWTMLGFWTLSVHWGLSFSKLVQEPKRIYVRK